MPATAQPLEFRAAFPDELGRAAYLDAEAWNFAEDRWFFARIDGPPERIVGVVRYSTRPDNGGCLDFRLTVGPGRELTGNEENFLAAFLDFACVIPHSLLRYADKLPEGHFLEHLLERTGFAIRYREQRFETDWATGDTRVGRAFRALADKPSALNAAEIISVRACTVESAIPLLCDSGLMKERELRSLWNSPDPTRLDRDASACLVLGGEVLGVVICADGGDHLRVLALAGRDDIPGARRRIIPFLMNHVLRTRKDRGYRKFVFRANVETARQTVNLAKRFGGRVTGEVRRWGRIIG